MMSKAKLVLFLVVVFLLPLAASARDLGACSGATGAVADDATFLAALQSSQVPPATAPAGDIVPKVNFCTKEVCSVARQQCREWCPFPCAMTFECNYPSCGSCISCSC